MDNIKGLTCVKDYKPNKAAMPYPKFTNNVIIRYY